LALISADPFADLLGQRNIEHQHEHQKALAIGTTISRKSAARAYAGYDQDRNVPRAAISRK
jgi:hypothetical protein